MSTLSYLVTGEKGNGNTTNKIKIIDKLLVPVLDSNRRADLKRHISTADKIWRENIMF